MSNEANATMPMLLDCTGLPQSTLYRKMADGTFPKPARRGRWNLSEVNRWLADPEHYRAVPGPLS